MTATIELMFKLIIAFSIDFNVSVAHISIEILPNEKMNLIINDPYRGERKADAFISTNKITFNYDHWKLLNEWQQKELVYHELGHLMFSLQHTEEANNIMNPYAGKNMYWVKPDGSNWNILLNTMKQDVIKYRSFY